ncbi:D-alanine--D-alanine ligase [Luteolibacter ambystomatis]|uniref:D-alanine--D-alanine ligase n=1 Tax=Luteolibacter ambystomatis TaxID=2824561 RepID=A0A975G9Z7_9BACT|nr:D-alanine--D-alanine ligase [Luteolibacter ambystomatis]QUE51485.1 D-alanine--D-alanine ligase [Luteolibacter ambystomatis]
MIDPNLLIAVLMGGPGSERDVSLASGKAVLKALQGRGFNVVGVDVTGYDMDLPEGTGLAFNVIHGTFGEDGQLQDILEAKGVPYTGAGSQSSRLAFDKNKAKALFLSHNVPTPLSEIVDVSGGSKLPQMTAPFVVKPPREGSSVGVHIVREQADAEAAMEDAAKYGNDILVEQFIEGKELTVGVFDDAALPIVHIAPRSGFYDMANKYPWLSGGAGSDYYCPADLDEATTKAVQDAALAAHRALGIEVYSRVDVLLDAQNRPFVLESNTIPGMTETSLMPKSAAAAGIPFDELCIRIAEISLKLRA